MKKQEWAQRKDTIFRKRWKHGVEKYDGLFGEPEEKTGTSVQIITDRY